MMMGSVSWVSEGVCGSAGQGIVAAGMCGQTVLMVSEALSHLQLLHAHPSIIQGAPDRRFAASAMTDRQMLGCTGLAVSTEN